MAIPNFFLVGAFKGGTTTIYHQLKRHPEVFMCSPKEPRFFAFDPANEDHANAPASSYPIRTLDNYLSLFDGVTDQKAVGDASPIYLNSDIAPARIAEFNPSARIIVSLRDPVARAFSGYQMHVRNGSERRPLEAALQPGERWVEGSLYAGKLENFYNYFPESQIKVVLLEQLGAETFREILEFLGVFSDFEAGVSEAMNVGGLPKSDRAQRSLRMLKGIKRRFRRARGYLPQWGVRAIKRFEAANLERAKLPADVDTRLAGYFLADAENVKSLTGLPTEIWNLRERAQRAP